MIGPSNAAGLEEIARYCIAYRYEVIPAEGFLSLSRFCFLVPAPNDQKGDKGVHNWQKYHILGSRKARTHQ